MQVKVSKLYEFFKMKLQNVPGREQEARELACFCLGIDKKTFFLNYFDEFKVVFDPEDIAFRRTHNGEPLAYILREWDFYGRAFSVFPGVLVPRIDSEFVLQSALKAFFNNENVYSNGSKPRILDLCCGSGILGVTFSLELKKKNILSEVILGDLSETALDCAKENLLRHDIKNVQVINLNATCPAPKKLGLFDVILCNPPYIRSCDIEGLERDVKDFEPRFALDGGADGLEFFRAISHGYYRSLANGGLMVFETGAGQGKDVVKIMQSVGYKNVRYEKDLEGNDRVAIGRR